MCEGCKCGDPPDVCDCYDTLFCADCQSDVDALDDDEVLVHLDAGHKLEPYGCEQCQVSLRE